MKKFLLLAFLFPTLAFASDIPRTFSMASFKYRGGSGRSYKRGYETAEVFLAALSDDQCNYPFFDLRLHRVENGKAALNLGLGWRHFCDSCQIVGFNIFYDYRHLRRDGDLQQLGLGLELLDDKWDLRVNGYLPFGDKRVLTGQTIIQYDGPFSARRKHYRRAMWGVDFEFGRCLYSCQTECHTFNFYGAIGPYYYGSNCCNALIGGMARLDINIDCYFSLNFYTTYDHYFKWKGQVEGVFNFPFSCLCECWDRYFFPVYRNDIIVTERICGWKANF